MKKQLFSILTATAMTLSAMPFTVSAETTDITATATETETIETMKFDMALQFAVNGTAIKDAVIKGKVKFFEYSPDFSNDYDYLLSLKEKTPYAEYSFTAENGRFQIKDVEAYGNCNAVVFVDKLPDGYSSLYGTEELIVPVGIGVDYFFSPNSTRTININSINPVIPCDNDYDYCFKLTDYTNEAVIENVKCTLYEYRLTEENSYIGKKIAEFNTSDYIDGYKGKLHYSLDKPVSDEFSFITVVLDNLPQEYLEFYEMTSHLYEYPVEDTEDCVKGMKCREFNLDSLINYSKSQNDDNTDNPFDINTAMDRKTQSAVTTLPNTDIVTTVITTANADNVKGDANCDKAVNMADAVIIMQSLANPDKYGVNGKDETHITAQGEKNGDMDGNGLTNADALEIQKIILRLS